MKQYIMGMITGASLILCAVMFMGANYRSYGKYQVYYSDHNNRPYLLNTATGQLFGTKSARVGENNLMLWYEQTIEPKFLFMYNDEPWEGPPLNK